MHTSGVILVQGPRAVPSGLLRMAQRLAVRVDPKYKIILQSNNLAARPRFEVAAQN